MVNRGDLEKLVGDIKAIAKSLKVPESELFLDEVELFLEEHQHHGYLQVRLFYEDCALAVIGLYCDAAELRHPRICSHHDNSLDDQIGFAIIYSAKETSEVTDQKERRKYLLE